MTLLVEGAELSIGRARVLSGVSVALRPGTVTALVGPNGAGKTSLLRIMSGEIAPASGAVRVDSRPLQDLCPQQQARCRSVMTQHPRMAFDYIVEEVLEMAWIHGCRERFRRAAMTIALDCDIRQLVGRKFNTLSGGERQRVQFARALLQIWRHREDATEPRYLLLDEPTASLDVAHELLLLRITRKISERNIGVLLILHDLNLAARFASHVILLANGAVQAAGSPEAVFTNNVLSQAYGARMHVERHERLGRLLIHTD